MKKILFLLILFYPLIVCGGCGDKEARIQENTARYDTAYNVRTGVSVSLGESEEAIKEKFAEDEYEIVPFTNQYEQKDPFGRYRYVFDNDRTCFAIVITDGTVSGLGIYPSHGNSIGFFAPKLKSDWYFRGGLTVREDKEMARALFGRPSWPAEILPDPEYGLFEDHPSGAVYLYGFDEDFHLLTAEELERAKNGESADMPTCYAQLSFGQDEMQAIVIRYGDDPRNAPGRQSDNYFDDLVGIF